MFDCEDYATTSLIWDTSLSPFWTLKVFFQVWTMQINTNTQMVLNTSRTNKSYMIWKDQWAHVSQGHGQICKVKIEFFDYKIQRNKYEMGYWIYWIKYIALCSMHIKVPKNQEVLYKKTYKMHTSIFSESFS